jgi:hypothetical protein
VAVWEFRARRVRHHNALPEDTASATPDRGTLANGHRCGNLHREVLREEGGDIWDSRSIDRSKNTQTLFVYVTPARCSTGQISISIEELLPFLKFFVQQLQQINCVLISATSMGCEKLPCLLYG